MEAAALLRAREIAESVTGALGGRGIFGVELFVRGDEVIFSEVSPRPHDTGMVTMATQNLSEFALHVRAILGLPVPSGEIPLRSPGASAVVLSGSELADPIVSGLAEALVVDPESEVRLFGKPEARPGRRMGVVLSCAADVDDARQKATRIAARLNVV
jgi:phosphoribosylglycinamide formyltransferase 2